MEIKDYLHLYIGCDVQTPDGIEQLIAVGRLGSEAQRFRTCSSLMSYTHDWHPSNKPLLRKLSDMTEEECDKYGIAYLNGEYTKDCFEADATYGTTFKVYGIKSLSERVIQMCKDGWDVFGLIPAGLAIDKTSLKN